VFTASTHGADQMFAQRYLSCASLLHARRALFVSGLVVLMQFGLFLALGLLLWAYYQSIPSTVVNVPSRPDRVLAYFIGTEFPIGLRGAMIAAVIAAAMSTLSSSLNSSAAAVVGNFFKRPVSRNNSEERYLGFSRVSILAFGAIQAFVAIMGIAFSDRLIDDVLRIQFFSGGMMLGVFLLIAAGYRTPFVGVVALTTGLTATILLAIGTEISWQWYACVGSLATFLAGVTASAIQNLRNC